MNVFDAVARRYSARAFSDRPVAQARIRKILEAANRSPSGGNCQPWHVDVLTGEPLQALVGAVAARLTQPDETEYPVYPPKLGEPYRTRRYQCGEALYAAIDIPREDRMGRLQQFAKNAQLFGAPVGLFFSIDRNMGPNQWAHLGMYIQTIMLLAVEEGLDTCPQEAWSAWHTTISEHLALPPERMFYCGMAMGYADTAHPINQWRTDRAALHEVARFHGFDEQADAQA